MTINIDDLAKLLGEITQGEWEAIKESGEWCIYDKDGRTVVELVYDEANARLIAAAPTIIKELVERVRKLQRDLDRTYNIIGQNIHPG